MKSEYCTYPAIFEYNLGQEIAVIFPDLNSATSGLNEKDAFKSAQELLGLLLFGLEAEKKIFPKASEIKDLNLKKNQKAFLIGVDMLKVRKEVITLSN